MWCIIKSAFVHTCKVLVVISALSGYSFAADWPDTQIVGPFICRADFSLHNVAPFLKELSELQNELVEALSIPTARESIEVYLFHDQKTYTQYLKRYFPNVPFRRAVYIKADGPGRVFAFLSEQFEIDMRHECTHALLHASFISIPLWLDEGLAGYFELPASQRISGSPHLSSIRINTWWGKYTPMENLEKCINVADMGKAEYRDSWAWVYFMLHSSATAQNELKLYINEIDKANPQELLSVRLKRRIPTLEKSFTSYFNKWKNPEATRLSMGR
jgi:hypothetical protein